MEPLIDKELIEGLTIDENLCGDLDCFVDKYLKLLPNITIEDEDIWTVSEEMLTSFGESIDRMKERKKIKQQNKNEAT